MKAPERPTLNVLNSVFKYLAAAILIFIPLYPKFPLFVVPFTYVAIRAEDFLIGTTLLVLIIKLLLEKQAKLPKISFQISIFLLVALVSTLCAIFVTKTVNPPLSILHFLRRIEYMSAFFIMYYAASNIGNRIYLFKLSVLPAIGVLLFGLAQIYLGAPVISTMDSESSKGVALTLRPGVMLNSTFAGHYDLAIYLIMIMTFIVSISFASTKKYMKIAMLIPFWAILWLFMQAGSRIGLIGLTFSIMILGYYYKKYILSFLYLSIVFATIFTSPQYLTRFQNIFNVIKEKITLQNPFAVYAAQEQQRAIQKDTSTSIRFDVEWPRAMRAFYKNPFLGTGYSSISLATDNDYLRLLGEVGILGLVSFLAILISIFNHLRSFIANTNGLNKLISISVMGIFVAFITSAIFIDVFESSKIAILFWSFVGLAFSTKNNA